MKANKFVVFGAVVFSAGVLAGQPQEYYNFVELDKNSDGYISFVEATGHDDVLKDWTLMDIDIDGKLEMSEFSAFESSDAPANTFVPPDAGEDGEPGAAPY